MYVFTLSSKHTAISVLVLAPSNVASDCLSVKPGFCNSCEKYLKLLTPLQFICIFFIKDTLKILFFIYGSVISK